MFAVSVPATSPNLGPGFDAVGVELDLRVRALVEPASCFSIDYSGPFQPTHPGFERMLIAAMQSIDSELPRIRVHIHNAIPLGRGLRSSAAARVLVTTSRAVSANSKAIPTTRFPPSTAASRSPLLPAKASNSMPRATFAPSSSCRNSISPPHTRALLPQQYEKADVVFSVRRAALLGAALASGRWNILREAMNDRLHQPYRAAIVPGLGEALAVDTPDLIGVVLSGAGPSVLALIHEHTAWRQDRGAHRGVLRASWVASQSYRFDFASRGTILRRYLTERKAA